MSHREKRCQWYLVAYDIADPRRLRKVHYRLVPKAFPVQHSVFLFREDAAGLKALARMLRSHTDGRWDDVRVYPIASPTALWMSQGQSERLAGLYPAMPTEGKLAVSVGWITRIRRLIQRRKT